MILTRFLDEIDKITSGYNKEQLRQVIHEVARKLPENERQDFIKQVREITKKTDKNVCEKNAVDFKKSFQIWNHSLDEIENGEKCLLEGYNENYDDWYNSSEEEFIYEDPDEIGRTLEEICKFIHKCVDEEQYDFAMKLGRRLFMQEIQTDGEYGGGDLELQELVDCKILNADLKKTALDTLYSCYQITTGEKRADILYEIWSNAGESKLTLEDLMQYAGEELAGFQEFLSVWISYLGNHKGALAGRLYMEAVELTDSVSVKFENAKKYVRQHPGIYRKILNDSAIERKQALLIGEDGMKRIDKRLRIRSEVALKTAEYAISAGKNRDFIDWCYIQAFSSDTNAVNYLRALLNCDDKTMCKEELNAIIQKYNGKIETKYNIYYGNYDANSELLENVPEKNMIYNLRFLNGAFIEVLNDGVSNRQALGWSGTFMKQGLAVFLLYLYQGEKLLPGISEMLATTKDAFGFSAEEYKKGLQIEETEECDEKMFFYNLFQQWKSTTTMQESDRQKILQHIEKLMEKRVAAIMEANRRNYYHECAAYIAAIGEVKETQGEKGARQRYLNDYAQKYPRRSAFRASLQSYGWKKR